MTSSPETHCRPFSPVNPCISSTTSGRRRHRRLATIPPGFHCYILYLDFISCINIDQGWSVIAESSLRDAAMKRQLGHNPRRHIHRREFLKQQLARIRNLNQRKIRPILTGFTEVDTPFVIVRRNNSTLATYMNFIFI